MKKPCFALLFLTVLTATASAGSTAAAGRQDVVTGSKAARFLAESKPPLDQSSTDTLNLSDQDLLDRAHDLVSRQRQREAVETYALLLSKHPLSPLAPQALYETSLYERDQLLADQALERLLKDYPQSAWAAKGAYRRGEVSFIREDFQKAAENFERFLAMKPLASEAINGRFQLALCRIQLREHKEALAILTELQRENPRGLHAAQLADAIADCRMELDEFDQAIVEWNWIVTNYPNFQAAAKVQFNIGLCHEALERIPEARQHYGQVSEKFPRSPEAILARLRLEDLDALERLFIKGGAGNDAATTKTLSLTAARRSPPH